MAVWERRTLLFKPKKIHRNIRIEDRPIWVA